MHTARTDMFRLLLHVCLTVPLSKCWVQSEIKVWPMICFINMAGLYTHIRDTKSQFVSRGVNFMVYKPYCMSWDQSNKTKYTSSCDTEWTQHQWHHGARRPRLTGRRAPAAVWTWPRKTWTMRWLVSCCVRRPVLQIPSWPAINQSPPNRCFTLHSTAATSIICVTCWKNYLSNQWVMMLRSITILNSNFVCREPTRLTHSESLIVYTL